MQSKKLALIVFFVLVGAILLSLSACQARTREIEVTRIVTEKETTVETVVEQETVIVQVTPTPEPVEQGPRTLVICQGQEPETLYIYGQSMLETDSALAAHHVQQAVYDGPIDNRSYGYQPVILEKLPSLADGDAVIETVTVETGDLVVDDNGDPVILEQGILVRPVGCYNSDCAVAFDGNPLEMEQLVVTFRLQEGIMWSDGTPLVANDSVYSFELVKDPDTLATSETAFRTASYEALDDRTVVWTGLPGFRDSNYAINFWPPLPEHIWGDFTALELIEAEESARRPIGWGPYVITEWVAGDHITLVKNQNYWRAGEGLPKFDTVIFRFVGQNSEANIASLLAGQCDIVDQTVHLEDQSKLLVELEAVDKLDAVFSTTPFWEHADMCINPVSGYDRPDFFESATVRQAIAYCLDRQQVVDQVLLGQSTAPYSYVPPEHPLANPEAKQYPFDPQAGSALLEEAGWIDDDGDPTTPRLAQDIEGISNGTALEFNYWTIDTPQRRAIAEILRDSLAQCGIQVNLEHRDRTEYLVDGPEGPIFGRSFDIGQFAWVAGVQPRCDFYLSNAVPSEENGWAGLNVTGFANEEYDAACNAALQLLPGQPGYEENHLEAQRIFAEQMPAVPLYLRLKLAATRSDMEGFETDPTESEMWNIEAFDYGE